MSNNTYQTVSNSENRSGCKGCSEIIGELAFSVAIYPGKLSSRNVVKPSDGIPFCLLKILLTLGTGVIPIQNN